MWSPWYITVRPSVSRVEGTVYGTYYGISPFEPSGRQRGPDRRPWWNRLFGSSSPRSSSGAAEFAALCHTRAGVEPGGWEVIKNGMVIEQQQILTTQNLAALYRGLELEARLQPLLPAVVRDCLSWICRRQQMKIDHHHARLIMIKNTAYAWRQMIFFLSFLHADERDAFMECGTDLLHSEAETFRQRFSPAWKGLLMACAGATPPDDPAEPEGGRRFLGWTRGIHWLMRDPSDGRTP